MVDAPGYDETPIEAADLEDEDDDDVQLDTEDFARAVVTDTDWTTETILSQLGRGKIQLNPRFQRRDAWSPAKKSSFIESVFLGLPIPQIVLAEEKGRRGSFIVLDGKQRLLSLLQFARGSEFLKTEDPDIKGHKLRNLPILGSLNGLDLDGVAKSSELSDDLDSFLNRTIRTVVVRSWPTEDFLNLVFLRLNTGSVQLSTQELRQALHPGPFSDYIDDFSSDSQIILSFYSKSGKPDFRMRDVELVLRYFAFKNFVDLYRGNLKQFLDQTVAELNAAWDSTAPEIIAQARELEEAITFTKEIFGTYSFQRWNEDKRSYEGRLNRSVFDIMVFYFSRERVRSAVRLNPEGVKNAFETLCGSDPKFNEALQSTTKSIEAVALRLGRWGQALKKFVPDLDAIPQMKNEADGAKSITLAV